MNETPILFDFVKRFSQLLLPAVVGACMIGCGQPEHEQRLNEIQMIGSHNSYKKAIDPKLLALVKQNDPGAAGLEYGHLPLYDQLELGLRSLEIDVAHDPTGGRYQCPQGIKWAAAAGISLEPHDTAHILSQPGMKVLHVPDIDFKTHCLTFKNCLSEIKKWSNDNPDHQPLMITINLKVEDDALKNPGATKVLPFNLAALDSLDEEIVSSFDNSKLITPALIAGNSKNLRDAVLENGWPALSSLKGKIMFILDASSEATMRYQSINHPKVMFVNVAESDPDAGFFILNEPIAQEKEITDLVKKGFLVRTRADADTREARTMDYKRFDAAKRSGAQLISTDYYLPALSPNGNFVISFGDSGYWRRNPILK